MDALGGLVDDGVGDAADGLGRAVVLLEADGRGVGEVAAKCRMLRMSAARQE